MQTAITDRLRPLNTMLHDAWCALRLVYSAAPRFFLFAAAFSMITGLVPGAMLWVSARLVGSLALHRAPQEVLALIFVMVSLAAFHELSQTLATFLEQGLEERAHLAVQIRATAATANFPDLRVHEQDSLRELALLAHEAADKVTDLVGRGFSLLFGLATGVPVLILTVSVTWWTPLVLLIGLIPTVALRAEAERRIWGVQEANAKDLADIGIVRRTLTQPEYGKDLRIYSMQAALMRAWVNRYVQILRMLFKVRARATLYLAGSAVFTGACLALPFLALARGFHGGHGSVENLVVLLGALINVSNALGLLSYNYGGFVASSCSFAPYRRFLRICDAARAKPSPLTQQASPGVALLLDEVSLQYAGTQTPTIAGVDLCVRDGECIALVGPNGAGKSSLLKMACGLLEPTEGRIAWGRSAGHRKPGIVTVFQACAPFPLTALEALATDDAECARRCLDAVGLGFLGNQLDVPLSSERHGGRDLSGGQWQRLSIARALAHAEGADLFLFDEPTSALDPESETRMMHLLREMAAGRSCVVVSHRLALTRFVDRIVVLDTGRIVEAGTHAQLLSLGGRYAAMFEAQASLYR